jgi:hypothetical protein
MIVGRVCGVGCLVVGYVVGLVCGVGLGWLVPPSVIVGVGLCVYIQHKIFSNFSKYY